MKFKKVDLGEIECFKFVIINFEIFLNSKMDSIEEKIFLARVAEQAERFEDMVDFL